MSTIDLKFLDSASILTVGLTFKLYEAWKKSYPAGLYNSTIDTIAGSVPAIRWWALHLKNFDEKRPITRREFAVWLDGEVNPFMENGIGLDGRVIHQFGGGMVRDPFRVESPVDTGEYIQVISVSQYGGVVDRDSTHIQFDSLYNGNGSNILGIYPVHPFDGLYEIGVPSVPHAMLFLPNGNRLEVVAENLSAAARYVQSVHFNGVALARGVLKHEELLRGGKLVFVMGALPNAGWNRK